MNAPPSCALICSFLLVPLAEAQQESWIATWTASPEPADPDPNQPIPNLQDQTIRERVRISVGGSQFRILLSNEYGSSPLLVGSLTVAVPNDPASVRLGSIQAVTFGGRKSITIPPGAVFETYWTTLRGVEAMDNSYRLLDLTVYERQEPWEDSPPGWRQCAKGAHPFRSDGPGAGSARISRPIAQWSRLKAGYSDDLGTSKR